MFFHSVMSFFTIILNILLFMCTLFKMTEHHYSFVMDSHTICTFYFNSFFYLGAKSIGLLHQPNPQVKILNKCNSVFDVYKAFYRLLRILSSIYNHKKNAFWYKSILSKQFFVCLHLQSQWLILKPQIPSKRASSALKTDQSSLILREDMNHCKTCQLDPHTCPVID